MIRHKIVSWLFCAIIITGCFFTVLPSAKQIAWNVIRNNQEYRHGNSINDYLNAYVNAFESAFNEDVFMKRRYIDLFGFLQRVMDKDVIPTTGFTGTIVRGSDNKLYTAASVTTADSAERSYKDIETYAGNMIELSRILRENNIDLLYVQAPNRYHGDVSVPIAIDAQTANDRIAFFMDSIRGKVDSINLAEKVFTEGRDYDDIFFKTDHHWKVESAFWCYQEICRYLNENKGYNIDAAYFDEGNWNKVILPNAYLGSSGVRVGSYYVGRDDFALYTPKFDTSFVRDYTSTRMVQYSGDFAHALLGNYDDYMKGDYLSITWGTYTGSDTSWVGIHNNNIAEGRKILVVKDSFALPVCAFLSTTCSELDIYDLRYKHDMSLKDYILKNRYDLVIFCYNPGAYSKKMFEFGV